MDEMRRIKIRFGASRLNHTSLDSACCTIILFSKTDETDARKINLSKELSKKKYESTFSEKRNCAVTLL